MWLRNVVYSREVGIRDGGHVLVGNDYYQHVLGIVRFIRWIPIVYSQTDVACEALPAQMNVGIGSDGLALQISWERRRWCCA